MIMTVIEIYITICISYLLLCIKLPPQNVVSSNNRIWAICSQSHKLTRSVSLSAAIPRSRLGKVPCVLTYVLTGSIQFHAGLWPLFLAW